MLAVATSNGSRTVARLIPTTMRAVSSHLSLQQVSQPDNSRLATILSIPSATADDKNSWGNRIPHELPDYDCFVESDPEDERLVDRLGEAAVLDKPLALFVSASQAKAARLFANAASEGGLCLLRIVLVRDSAAAVATAAAAALEGIDVPTTWVDDLSGGAGSSAGSQAFFELRETLAMDVAAALEAGKRTFADYNAERPYPDAYSWRPLLRQALADHAGNEALVDDETVLTLQQTYERAAIYADALEDRGCASAYLHCSSNARLPPSLSFAPLVPLTSRDFARHCAQRARPPRRRHLSAVVRRVLLRGDGRAAELGAHCRDHCLALRLRLGAHRERGGPQPRDHEPRAES
jgi:hypothetical protein